MENSRFHSIIGLLICLGSTCFIICNSVCLYCIRRGNLHLLKNNPVFLITGFNMICDTFQLFVFLFYMGPSVMLGSWLFSGGEYSEGVVFIGTLALEFWFLTSWIQILLAISRFHIIMYPKHNLFTVGRILKLFVLYIMLSVLLTAVYQHSGYCCKLIPDYRMYGYTSLNYTKNSTHVLEMFIGVPNDVICSTLCLISYIMTFHHIYKLRTNVTTSVTPKDIRMSIQCCFVFLSYLISWLAFCIFPLLEIEAPEIHLITPLAFILNGGINAVIYLLFNADIQHELKCILGYNTGEPETTIGALSTTSVHNLDGLDK